MFPWPDVTTADLASGMRWLIALVALTGIVWFVYVLTQKPEQPKAVNRPNDLEDCDAEDILAVRRGADRFDCGWHRGRCGRPGKHPQLHLDHLRLGCSTAGSIGFPSKASSLRSVTTPPIRSPAETSAA
jgi:hypothetical protein